MGFGIAELETRDFEGFVRFDVRAEGQRELGDVIEEARAVTTEDTGVEDGAGGGEGVEGSADERLGGRHREA